MDQLDFLSKYTNLDKFQLDSFKLIENFNDNPENILITAHTGSGKSLVAEYGIYYYTKNNKKVIYTSPIKSLSNQKFYDFNEKFNKYNISIGIITGDIKFAPQSNCIIMTTEILLNLLTRFINKNIPNEFDINFDEVGCIIFDEIHYINDIDRGNIWEQSIMCISNNIQLIMLSATLNQPEIFGKWIENVQNKPTNIISTTHRVVPLYFNLYYYISEKTFSKLSIQKKAAFEYNKLVSIYNTNDKKFDNIMYDKIIKLTDGNENTIEIINGMLNNFNKEEIDNFPLLFFVLNKKKCLEYAKSICHTYNNIEEQIEVENYINFQIRNMNLDYIKNNDTYKLLIKLIIKGIAIHHSGLLPVFKEIIEILYNKKLIKVLFATETFSVGLNMPTKTVVFCNLFKCNRILESHEFIQMAGRAGRRNIDILGNIIILPQLYRNNNILSLDLKNIISGKGQIIESKFNINEILLLKLIKNNKTDIEDISNYIKKSMMSMTNEININYQEKIVQDLEIDLSEEEIINIKKYNEYNNSMFKLSKKQLEEKKKLLNDKIFIEKYNKKLKYNIEKKKLDNINNYLINEILFMFEILRKYNLIDNYNILTNKGYLATFITDIHPIPIIDIITHPEFNNLDEDNIITLFSSLIFDEKNDILELKEFKNQNINFKWIKLLEDIYDKTINNFFNFKYIWLIDEFIKTNKYLSNYEDEDYLFEGNFIRSMNKLLNLFNDLKNLYEDTKNIKLVEKIDICIEKLNKDWLKLDSIYLRMSGIVL